MFSITHQKSHFLTEHPILDCISIPIRFSFIKDFITGYYSPSKLRTLHDGLMKLAIRLNSKKKDQRKFKKSCFTVNTVFFIGKIEKKKDLKSVSLKTFQVKTTSFGFNNISFIRNIDIYKKTIMRCQIMTTCSYFNLVESSCSKVQSFCVF